MTDKTIDAEPTEHTAPEPVAPKTFSERHGCSPKEWLEKAPELPGTLKNEIATQEATLLESKRTK